MKYECYKMGSRIFTPLDYGEVTCSKEHTDLYILDGITIAHKVELRKCTFLDKIRLTPAITCAILARLVRNIKGHSSDMEKSLMRFYYQQEVKIRG